MKTKTAKTKTSKVKAQDLSIAALEVKGENNYFAIEPDLASFKRAKFVVIQAPFDKTVTYGGGTGGGPAAIWNASQQVELFDEQTGEEPILQHGVCTLKPLNCDCDGEEINRRIYEVAKQVVKAGKIPILIGGEHTVSFGAVKACWEKYPDLSILHFDAHSDLRDEYHGQKFNHATAAARMNELAPIVQCGIRSREAYEPGAKERPVTVYHAFKYNQSGPWVDEAVGKLSRNVYLTIDVDGFDPSVFPATGTPEPGGLTWWLGLEIIERAAKSRNIVGFDVVEVAPVKGNHVTEFAAARLVGKVIAYIARYCLSNRA
ncbi:MAG: agmatinase [Planctomycetes bacterium]|nr:agmatinase [Planctomycetota bacterium]